MGRPLVLDDPDPEGPGPGLFQVLYLSPAYFDLEVAAVLDDALDFIGAGLAGLGDEHLGRVQQLDIAIPAMECMFLHLIPPTVMADILMVGQPSPTGTDWPSLPHVPV